EIIEGIKKNGFSESLKTYQFPTFDESWTISHFAEKTSNPELKEYYERLAAEYVKERKMIHTWEDINRAIYRYSQLESYYESSRCLGLQMEGATRNYRYICNNNLKDEVEKHSDIPGLKAAYDEMRENATKMYNELEAEGNFAENLLKKAFNINTLAPDHATIENGMMAIENSAYGKSHPEFIEKKRKEVDAYVGNMQKVADEINGITSDDSTQTSQKISELKNLAEKLRTAVDSICYDKNYEDPNMGAGYKHYMISGLRNLSHICDGTSGNLIKSLKELTESSNTSKGKSNKEGGSRENVVPGMEVTFTEDDISQERMDNALWCQDIHSSMQRLRPWARKSFANATWSQRMSVWDYTKGSGNYNRTLSGYQGDWNKINYVGIGNVDMSKNHIDNSVKHLTAFLNDNELPEDMWLQRGTSEGCICAMFGLDEFSFDALKAKEGSGEAFMQPSFCSCSASKGSGFKDKQFILNIYAPKGTKGAYVAPASYYGGTRDYKGEYFCGVGRENELLLQRNTEFKLLKCTHGDDGKVYLDLAVVGQYPLDYDKVDYPGKHQKKTKKKSP
ncbi:MAG: ADP-ribosyltransferase, partial [Bacteroidales bacterium]|nr:ADP-ribosyltransferase [Bacteroidales bacterium]